MHLLTLQVRKVVSETEELIITNPQSYISSGNVILSLYTTSSKILSQLYIIGVINNRLTQVLKTEMSSKAVYYFCELHRKGGSREIAKNYCNRSLQLDPNATGALYALGLFSFGETPTTEQLHRK